MKLTYQRCQVRKCSPEHYLCLYHGNGRTWTDDRMDLPEWDLVSGNGLGSPHPVLAGVAFGEGDYLDQSEWPVPEARNVAWAASK